jgi:transposase
MGLQSKHREVYMPVYIGIDWSQTKHDVCILNEAGAPLARLVVTHSPEGFQKLDAQRQPLGLAASECLIGIETAHNLLIDFLWGHGYQQVFVIPPNVVNSTRGRYRQSGARNDQSDAFVLADVLRTDRARLQPWKPDHVLTRQIRSRVSLLGHLTHQSVQLSNRLRAVLWRYYPAALNVFGTLDAQITLEFVRLYSTPQHAAALTLAEFKAFAQRHRYPRPKQLPARFVCLQQPQPEADRDTVCVFQGEAVQLATLLLGLVQTKTTVLKELRHLFEQHPDAPIFGSLPGAGELLAPALLAKFGDDRARFPSPASVQALAGTCPVTDASGKKRVIKFRKACDREFRVIAQQWAMASLTDSTWANAYWQHVRPHCDSNSHAYRCLANRWLAVAWKLWQTRQPYNEAYHLQQRAQHSKPRS